MIIEIIEEFLTVFVKGLAKKIGSIIRSVWYGEKSIYEETPESKWNFRIGIIVICLIFIGIVLVYF